jgi:hypothetical protein
MTIVAVSNREKGCTSAITAIIIMARIYAVKIGRMIVQEMVYEAV